MIKELNHFGIEVRDLAESVAFYRDILDGHIQSESRIDSVPLEIVMLEVSGSLVELLYYPDADTTSDRAFGMNHLAFLSDDVEADFRRLTDAGYASIMEPRLVAPGVRNAFVGDPDGTRIELLCSPQSPRVGIAPNDIFIGCDHLVVRSRDRIKALRFYRDFLGMVEVDSSGRSNAQRDDLYVKLGPDVLAIDRCESEEGLASFTLRVNDLGEARHVLAKRELHPLAEPSDHTHVALGRSDGLAYEDPNGVRFFILETSGGK